MEENLLEKDSFTIDSWEECLKYALKHKKTSEFVKKFDEFVYLTNAPLQREIEEYATKRMGEFAQEDELEKIKKIKEQKLSRPIRDKKYYDDLCEKNRKFLGID